MEHLMTRKLMLIQLLRVGNVDAQGGMRIDGCGTVQRTGMEVRP